MSRPADGLCASPKCRRPLPAEDSREDLTRGTDTCTRCARAELATIYKSPAASAWLRGWLSRMAGALRDKV